MDLQPTPVSPKSSNDISTISEEQPAVGNSSDHLQKHEAPAEPSKSSSPQQIDSSMQDTNGMNENTNSGKDEDEDMDNASEISDFSELSGESWHPVAGPFAWVQEQMRQGQNARSILEDLVPPGTSIPDDMDPIMLWRLILNIVSDPPQRKKLENINTLEDVVHLLKTCKNIIVLTGAGVSVSCGIPDFRSRDGVYARLAVDFPNLPDPQAMFDIHYFRSDPRPFFKFAKEIYPGQFKPSLCHHFIRLIESQGKLLRNYTQNIDTLEQEAGIERVIQCHGSFATASCTSCGLKVKSDEVREDIFKQVIPKCPQCPPTVEDAIMKPDIVFFGESLPEDFHQQMAADKDKCDLLIVIGSSLKVRPVALIPNSVLADVPQILINRERLHYLNFDIELLGNCDDIVAELCRRLGAGWDQLATPGPSLTEVALSSLPTPPVSPPLEQTSSSSSSLPTNQTSSSSFESNNAEKPTPSSSSSSSSLVEDKKKKQEHESTSLGGGVDSTQNNVRTETDRSVVSEKEEGGVVSFSSSDVSTALPPSSSAIGDECGKQEALLPETRTKTEQVSTSTDNCGGDPSVNREGSENKDPTTSDVVSSTSTSSGLKKHSGHHHHHHHNHHHHQHHHHSHHNHHHHQQSHHNRHHDHHHHHHHQKHHHHHKHHDDDQPNADCSEAEPIHKKPRLESDKEASATASTTTTTGGGGGETADLSSSSSAIEQRGGEEDIKTDNEMEEMLQARKNRVSLALRLADDQFLFLPPSRYVFKGAEVFSDDDDDEDDSDDGANDDEDDGENEMGDADNGDNEEKKEEKATGKEVEKEKENNDATNEGPLQECGSSKDTIASSSDGPLTSTDVAISSSSTTSIENATTTTTATCASSSVPVDSSLPLQPNSSE